MSDVEGGRRAWRARNGVEPRRYDLVWGFVNWLALFPGIGMAFAALGGRRGPRLTVDETWLVMLVCAATLCVLVVALAVRRMSGVVPGRYPRGMFGWIIFISIAAPAFAWVRLAGQLTTTGWLAIALCAAAGTLAALMLVPTRVRTARLAGPERRLADPGEPSGQTGAEAG